MKKVALVLSIIASLLSPGLAQLSQSNVDNDINNQLLSCGNGCNTAATLRGLLDTMVAATFQAQGTNGLILSGTPSVGWMPLATSPTTSVWGPPPGGVSIASFGGKGDCEAFVYASCTDNYPAWTAALKALGINVPTTNNPTLYTCITNTTCGGTVYFPPGVYYASCSYDLPSNVHIVGAGQGATTLIGNLNCPIGLTRDFTVTSNIVFTGTDNIGYVSPATYAINAPTEGSNQVTTTTPSNAGNLAPGNTVMISGPIPVGLDFWLPTWTTTVTAVNASTGVVTLAEDLPFGGTDITLIQKIVYQPINVSVSYLTVMAYPGTAAIQFQGPNGAYIDHVTIGIAPTGTVTDAVMDCVMARNCIISNSISPGVVEIYGSFDSVIKNNFLNGGAMVLDGGAQNNLVEGNTLTQPSTNGSVSPGLSIPFLGQKNRVIGNNFTNLLHNGIGITVGDINNTFCQGSNALIGNTFSGIDTSVIGMSVVNSCNNIIDSPIFYGPMGDGISVSNGSLNTAIIAPQIIGTVTTPFVVDATSTIKNTITPKITTFNTSLATTIPVGYGLVSVSNASATSVTNFTGGNLGDIITLLFADGNTTLVEGSTIFLRGAQSYNPPATTVMQFQLRASGQWYELSRTQANSSPEPFIRGVVIPGSAKNTFMSSSGFANDFLGYLGWTASSSDATISPDTTLCRSTAGVVEIGSGSTCGSGGGLLGAGFTATAVAPTVSAGQIGYGSTTVAAGTATCPTGTVGGQTVAGCIVTNIAGTAHYVPYF